MKPPTRPIAIPHEFLDGADLGSFDGLGPVLVAAATLQDTNVPGQRLNFVLDLREDLQENLIWFYHVLPSLGEFHHDLTVLAH